MVLTLSIMLIIVAFSLYDYFSSKSWQLVTSKERNETVFENRNKEYGAYKNRNDYDKRILLIFLGFTVGVGALWGASNLFKPLEQKKPTEIPMDTWAAKPIEDEDEPEIPEPVTEEVATPTKAEIVAFNVIEITDKPELDTKLIPVDPTKNIGNEAQIGENDGEFDLAILTKEKGKGGGGVIEIKEPEDKIYPVVDEDAKYPGGIPALHQFIADNIEMDMIDGNAKVYLKFVVDIDGTVSGVTVTNTSEDCKSCEKAAIKVVKSLSKWTPGKVNGKPVRSYFRIPINIKN
ncbi:energy transducer TonB [Fluviicola taffensis]|uniref:energy transducer TonB n=1 Tax=Fluviicola taffensis TaxID=191579 RepID=UPI003137E318